MSDILIRPPSQNTIKEFFPGEKRPRTSELLTLPDSIDRTHIIPIEESAATMQPRYMDVSLAPNRRSLGPDDLSRDLCDKPHQIIIKDFLVRSGRKFLAKKILRNILVDRILVQNGFGVLLCVSAFSPS